MPETQETASYARQLIHVPILHASADMGTMAEGLEAACVERFGRRHWQEYLELIEDYWQIVPAELERLKLDYHQADLYQDGLPVCGRELEIVRKAAAMGSENYRLLLNLVDRGATLMGTEDPSLLLKEYQTVKAALGATGDAGASGQAAQAGQYKETLSKRDAYIGRRIGQSLRPGRTAILFLGMMHNVESFLPTDIVVRRLAPSVGRHGRAR